MMLAKSLQSAAGNAATEANYIEDFFSVWVRAGTGSSQTVTTGIEEDTGALVISKARSAATDWAWYDTFRGANKELVSNSTAAQTTQSQGLTSFNSNGHTWGTLAKVNTGGTNFVDFVLKPQPKFFDVVTWAGTSGSRAISHALDSTPGCIIIKRTDSTDAWYTVHRSLPNGFSDYLTLNTTSASVGGSEVSSVGSSTFTVSSYYNGSGSTWVAYVFAHDAGGFGESGEENVISCGSFTTDGSGNATVSLGYEPQWLLLKRSSSTSNWAMQDTMRGWTASTATGEKTLYADLANAEASQTSDYWSPTSTGFTTTGAMGSGTYIYIAIRRGPMKVPESGTSVFDVKTATQDVNSSSRPPAVNFVTDFAFYRKRETTFNWGTVTRLAGSGYLFTNTTNAEASGPFAFDVMNGFYPNTSPWDSSGDYVFNYFRRAPGFFDVVCYTGDGSVPQAVPHNLEVVPELMIVKRRNDISNWAVYNATNGPNYYMNLNTTAAAASQIDRWRNTAPTSTNFYVGATSNAIGATYVAYLFATCPGVSKVGSYTGTGTTQQINCGFTAGARFVLIKRTDSTGDWYVWDSARGIVAGNDPYLLLNSTAAEVTSTDYVDTYSAGFEISSTAPAAINASGGSFIFLAIA